MKKVYILIVTFILSGCASKKIENNENIKYKHLIISEKRDPGGYWEINSPVFMSNDHKKVFTEENNTDFYTAFYNTYNNSFTTSNITSCNIVEYFDSGTKNNKNICSMKKIKNKKNSYVQSIDFSKKYKSFVIYGEYGNGSNINQTIRITTNDYKYIADIDVDGIVVQAVLDNNKLYYVKSSEDVIADSENGIQIYSYDIKTGKTRKIYNARKNTYITSVFVNNNRLFFSEYDYKKENTNIYRHGSDKKIKIFNNQYINVLQQEIKNRNTSFYKYISDNNNETIESYFSIKDGNMSLAQERCNITDNRSILNNYGFYCVNNDGNAIRINLDSKKKENFKLNISDYKRDSLVWFYFFE